MIHRLTTLAAALCRKASRRKRLLIGMLASVLIVPAAAVAGSYAIISPYQKFVLNGPADSPPLQDKPRVGIVLGAGVTRDGKPYRELRSRLDVAADALRAGSVDKLILSGDNRFTDYNEPRAMRDYLVSKRGVDAASLQEDFAGRSTYESCERAAKIFGLHQAVIFSAGSHLPRAIYLCRQFGVESYGVASKAEANNATRREAMARVKAVLNIYVRGEPTVLGTPISLK